MAEQNASEIIDSLGESFFLERLGMTERNLRHIRQTGKFASGYYAHIRAQCEESGVRCHISAFNWKQVANKLGDASNAFQEVNQKLTARPASETVERAG